MATPQVPAPTPALLLLLCILAARYARPEPVPGDVMRGCGVGGKGGIAGWAWPGVPGIAAAVGGTSWANHRASWTFRGLWVLPG